VAPRADAARFLDHLQNDAGVFTVLVAPTDVIARQPRRAL